MGLDLEGRVPGRSVGPSDLRKEVSKIFLEHGGNRPHIRLSVPPSHPALSRFPPDPEGNARDSLRLAWLARGFLLLSTFLE